MSLRRFACVTDALGDPIALFRIATVAAEDGRLFWRQGNGKMRCWYESTFDVPVSDVVEAPAPSWMSSPLSVERPERTPERTEASAEPPGEPMAVDVPGSPVASSVGDPGSPGAQPVAGVAAVVAGTSAIVMDPPFQPFQRQPRAMPQWPGASD